MICKESRGKVSGIGLVVKKLMEDKDISIKELSKKTKIPSIIIRGIIKLKIEPYAIPEMSRILFYLTDNETGKIIWDKWIKLVEKNKIL